MVDFAFLDSGTGGIPYLLHMLKVNPDVKCVYVGDTVNFPYGEKTHEEIVKATSACVKKIIEKFAPKIIVIACNTISVNTLDIMREIYPDQTFVGTVPAIKVAGEISKKRKIGLLATRSCVEHPYNQDLKLHFASDCVMFSRPDPDLIQFIEKQSFTATRSQRENACRPAVDFFKQNDCDVIILGCTHFLNVADEMQTVAGNELKVVDSRQGVINHALELLSQQASRQTKLQADETKLQAETKAPATVYVTGFLNQNDKKEYDYLCKNYNLKFGGEI